MRFLVVLIILILIAGGNTASAQKPEYGVRIKGGRQLIVTHQRKAHALKLVEQIDAAKITDAEVLFAASKDGLIYLVLDVSGQSKLKEDARHCGAGIESNLIWVKLDPTWKILDSKSARYESCWAPTTSFEGYKINGNTLSIEIEDYQRDLDVTLTYDAGQPEKGFKITEKATAGPK